MATNLSGTIDLVNLTASDNVEHGSSVRGGSPTLSVTGGLFSGNDLYGIHFDAVSNATISNVTVDGNGAVDAAAGGIFASTSKPAAVITIQDFVVKNNVAAGSAGIYVGGTGRAQLERTTVTGNLATFSDVSDGGGILIATSATGNVIQDSLIQNNETTFGAGGGISHHSSGSLLVERTTVDGGGISQDQSATAALTVRQSTFSNNTATATASSSVAVGGGGARLKTALIENSTFTGNTAGDDGGAIFVDVTAVDVQLVNSTVTLNSAGREGGGVYNEQSSIYLRGANSTFAGNTANSAGGTLSQDIRGDFGSGNLVGDIAGSTGVSLTFDLSGTAAELLDPRLAPLADNGGTTLTHNPYPDSPAIDGVNFATNYVLATDQRGVSRPQGSFRDIGAVEYTASAVNTANLLVTQNDALFEFNADRQIVQSSVIPYPGGRDATNVARDVTIAADGTVHVYNGSVAPYLSTLDPATSFTTYTHDAHSEWNTTDIVEGGGAAAYENYVFVSDTGSSNAGGLIRFDTTTGDSLRFESGVSTYVDVNVGLDGLLYALNAYSASGSRVDVFDITTLQKISTVQLNARYVSVAADSDGRIYAGNVSGTIVRYGTSDFELWHH
ncbi:MAG: right-handed parallel beta-helix repeat-containing protein [Fuerstiella sp.]|nr:right-handed parallel beta-helix repeat-containing protein [Fuerstiella sp.]